MKYEKLNISKIMYTYRLASEPTFIFLRKLCNPRLTIICLLVCVCTAKVSSPLIFTPFAHDFKWAMSQNVTVGFEVQNFFIYYSTNFLTKPTCHVYFSRVCAESQSIEF